MTSDRSPDLVGRSAELSALGNAIAAARAGEPRLVLVEGMPGVGKTATIEQLVAGSSGLRVLRASGEERERRVAFGVVDQLLRRGGAQQVGDPGVAAGDRILELGGGSVSRQ